jgi:PAS domain S-box-containing protein
MENMRRNLIELTTELRQREAEAQAVLKGVVEGVFAVDASRTIRYANPQAARMLGLESSEVVGRFCGDVLRPIGPDGVRPCETDCPILRARADGSGRATEVLERADGTRRTVVITSARVRRRDAGPGDARRDGGRGRATRARLRAGPISRMSSARRSPRSWHRSSCCTTVSGTCPRTSCSRWWLRCSEARCG